MIPTTPKIQIMDTYQTVTQIKMMMMTITKIPKKLKNQPRKDYVRPQETINKVKRVKKVKKVITKMKTTLKKIMTTKKIIILIVIMKIIIVMMMVKMT